MKNSIILFLSLSFIILSSCSNENVSSNNGTELFQIIDNKSDTGYQSEVDNQAKYNEKSTSKKSAFLENKFPLIKDDNAKFVDGNNIMNGGFCVKVGEDLYFKRNTSDDSQIYCYSNGEIKQVLDFDALYMLYDYKQDNLIFNVDYCDGGFQVLCSWDFNITNPQVKSIFKYFCEKPQIYNDKLYLKSFNGATLDCETNFDSVVLCRAELYGTNPEALRHLNVLHRKADAGICQVASPISAGRPLPD